jgi:uncharacterized protein (DUF2062 family)
MLETRHRWLKPFVELLKQGVSAEKIALTISLGLVLGVTPVLGSTTMLCTAAAVVFRLNLPAILLVNGLVYPFQLMMLIPFYKLGALAFRTDASTISLGNVVAMIRADAGHAIRSLWVVTIHALAAWLVMGAICAVLVYVALLPIVRRLHGSIAAQEPTTSI